MQHSNEDVVAWSLKSDYQLLLSKIYTVLLELFTFSKTLVVTNITGMELGLPNISLLGSYRMMGPYFLCNPLEVSRHG
jgi:hypothetical protein